MAGLRPRRIADPDRLAGSAFGLGAAVAFGVVVVVQRSLATDDVPAPVVVGGRYGIAALGLLALLALRRRPLRPQPGERLRAALLGAFGYVVHSTLFYFALHHGSAGTVAMVFYVYPTVVVAIEMVARLRPARARALVAPVLSALAVGLVVTGDMFTIAPLGFGLALAAAMSVSTYLLCSSRLIRRSPPMVTAAWVAGGVAMSMLTLGSALGQLTVPRDALARLALAGVATAAATTFLYSALSRLGAGPTAVFMTLQALVALLLGGAVLGEPVTLQQLVGGLGLLVGAGLASSARQLPKA